MATAVVSGIIDANNNGTPFDDLALKVYVGLVLGAYNLKTVTAGRHIERMIMSGKQAQFPAVGRAAAPAFHTRGTEITFQQINSNEYTIDIQDLLLSPLFIDVLDEAKSHFDVRREYAVQQGQALAEHSDARVFMSMIAGSRTATPVVTGLEGGARQVLANADTDASVLKALIYDAAELFDTNNIPAEGRNLFLRPSQYYLLLQDGEFIDRDFNDAGNGSRANAIMRNAADFAIVKSTNIPSTDLSGDTSLPTNLRLDYSANVAVASHMSSAGSVTLIGLQFESEYDLNRQGTMLVAKMAKGYDFLRQEASTDIATA
jgi:hypothetical protein